MARILYRLALSLVVIVAAVLISLPFVRHSILSSPGYACVRDAIVASPAVAAELGPVREVRLPWLASERMNADAVSLSVDVIGERASARLYVRAVQARPGHWEVRAAYLRNRWLLLAPTAGPTG